MDRLTALSVFKAVVDSGSFAGAASALDISRPAASRMVHDLETLLGVRLLHRTTRRLALTTVGEDILRRAGDLLQSYDELASIGRLSASEPAGVIRMAAPASFARHYLGPALAGFRARYPQVQVDLQLCEGTINAVLAEVDLALCLPEDLGPMHVARPLASAEVGIYAAPIYLVLKGEPTHPSQLDQHDCLTSRTAGTGATWSFQRMDRGDPCVVRVKGALHANQIEVLADAAAHGAGIVMLPAFMAQAAESQSQLRRILPGWRVAPLALQLAYNSRRNQPMSVRKLIEHLVETLGTAHEDRATPAPRPLDDEAPAADAKGCVTTAAGCLLRQSPMRERFATA